MKEIKRICLLFVMVLVVTFMAGCANKVNKKEELMKEYATSYYENHMAGFLPDEDANEIIDRVDISMLKMVNELNIDEKYDLSKLSNCKDSSYVDLIINPENQIIEKYEFHLECK